MLYVVCGDQFAEYFRLSYGSLRGNGYTGTVTVLTDKTTEIRVDGANIIREDVGDGHYKSRILKCSIDQYTDAENNVFIDSDTYVANPIDILFDMPKGWNIAMARDVHLNVGEAADKWRENKYATEEELKETVDVCGIKTIFFNDGVIAFRKNQKTEALFEQWRQEWMRYRYRDQMALARALTKTNTEVKTLGLRYNAYPMNWVKDPKISARKKIVIIHFVGEIAKRRWKRFVIKPNLRGFPDGFYGQPPVISCPAHGGKTPEIPEKEPNMDG